MDASPMRNQPDATTEKESSVKEKFRGMEKDRATDIPENAREISANNKEYINMMDG
jgi:hypothetical protein